MLCHGRSRTKPSLETSRRPSGEGILVRLVWERNETLQLCVLFLQTLHIVLKILEFINQLICLRCFPLLLFHHCIELSECFLQCIIILSDLRHPINKLTRRFSSCSFLCHSFLLVVFSKLNQSFNKCVFCFCFCSLCLHVAEKLIRKIINRFSRILLFLFFRFGVDDLSDYWGRVWREWLLSLKSRVS